MVAVPSTFILVSYMISFPYLINRFFCSCRVQVTAVMLRIHWKVAMKVKMQCNYFTALQRGNWHVLYVLLRQNFTDRDQVGDGICISTIGICDVRRPFFEHVLKNNTTLSCSRWFQTL